MKTFLGDWGRERIAAQGRIEQATDATERRSPGWTEAAAEAIRGFASGHGEAFTIEIARQSIACKLDEPHDNRSWGGATQLARKRGYIVPIRGKYMNAFCASDGSLRQCYRRGAAA